ENPHALSAAARLALKNGQLGSGESMLVLVDQFEELFRYEDSADEDVKAAYVSLLMEGYRQHDFPVYVMLTMRTEYLIDCMSYRDLPQALNESQFLVPRLSREQRRKAIEGPVRLAGARIAPALVQTLLNAVETEKDQLPVLQ